MINNRVFRTQADYLCPIVRKPIGWKPTRLDETPSNGEFLSQHFVVSCAKAMTISFVAIGLQLRRASMNGPSFKLPAAS
ncbi:hypothetical protein Pla8534_01070 [Lignipirellula cremea]|uniref:Uncharacterized protein n=1 Tax=Lignipirellula cremea TaxID=2528010 RepID=A0A518DKK4_9BACT|nr:hypothetical protein Pla8534_01070 [Lignipirellula cremea]